jgi:hypothetical protein
MLALLNIPAPIRFLLGLAVIVVGIAIHQYLLAAVGGAVLLIATFRMATSYRKNGSITGKASQR